jgi:hypothetical protein
MGKHDNTRSVDSKTYESVDVSLNFYYYLGSMSIQEASIYLLEQYYKDFPVFNPWLENAHQTHTKRHGTFSNKSIGSQSNTSTIATGGHGNKHVLTGDLTRPIRSYNDR